MVKTFIQNLSKAPFRSYQSQNAETASSLAQSIQSAEEVFDGIFDLSCSSESEKFCGFLQSLRSASSLARDIVDAYVNNWEDISQESYKQYTERIKQSMLVYFSRYDHLMNNKNTGCYFTQLRKKMESHKGDTQELIENYYTDSTSSFTSQIATFNSHIGAYKSTIAKVYDKCSARENPQECANNFIAKATGLEREYKNVVNQAVDLVQSQLTSVGPSSDEIVAQVESKKNDNPDEFEAVLKTCQ